MYMFIYRRFFLFVFIQGDFKLRHSIKANYIQNEYMSEKAAKHKTKVFSPIYLSIYSKECKNDKLHKNSTISLRKKTLY